MSALFDYLTLAAQGGVTLPGEALSLLAQYGLPTVLLVVIGKRGLDYIEKREAESVARDKEMREYAREREARLTKVIEDTVPHLQQIGEAMAATAQGQAQMCGEVREAHAAAAHEHEVARGLLTGLVKHLPEDRPPRASRQRTGGEP
jgi:hypothetical protein